jgi:seryl-tRNA synthetase
MERVEKARARLDEALERLEAAQQALDDRMRVLKAAVAPGTDWQELIRAVEAVQKDNHTLVEREEKLRERLDHAIARLSAMLDAGAPNGEAGRDEGRPAAGRETGGRA